MKKILLIIGAIATIIAPQMILASSSNLVFADAKTQIESAVNEVGGSENKTDVRGFIGNIIKTMFFIVGVLAVIVIIFAGVTFVMSAGNSQTIQKAKTTIIYAVIGLIVSILSYAIVNFVVSSL
jgi:hypothetical protein cdivTM_30108